MIPPRLTSDLALFLDFDGTLVEIAPTPDSVVVPDHLPGILAETADALGGALAIVSGRTLDDVTRYLHPLVAPGSGSHGVERRRADGSIAAPDPEIGRVAAEIIAGVAAKIGTQPGLLFEDKPWSAALHYRGAPALEAECIAVMQRVVAAYPGWEVIIGKMIVEARFAGFSKASAVDAFMQEAPFKGRVPVFIGDDRTDEDGMQAAEKHGGYGIKIGEGSSIARYRLTNPQDVWNYLAASRV